MIASDLPRTVETAALVAPGREVEAWPDLREIRGEKLSSIPPAELEAAFVHAFRGVVPNEKRFLGGETIGELFDRVVPALDRLLADGTWDTVLLVLHGAVNRAILSHALTGTELGHLDIQAENIVVHEHSHAPGLDDVHGVSDLPLDKEVRVLLEVLVFEPCGDLLDMSRRQGRKDFRSAN